MAFSSTILCKSVFGNKRIAYGTFTNGTNDTGGDINTGLKICEFIVLQPKGTAVSSNQAVVNKTLPIAGNAITIVTDAGVSGYWFAIGV